MTVSLDPILAAVQDNQIRQPICKILSCENTPSIPFDGNYLSTSAINEQHPEAKIHSTGRLFVAYLIGPDPLPSPNQNNAYYIRYGYTDVDKTYFTYVDLPYLGSFHIGGELSVCELEDGRVGIVWTETYSTTRYIKYHVLSVDGADYDPVITGTIFTQTKTPFFSGPTVTCLSDDSCLMVYGTQDGENHYHLYKRTSADFITWSSASEIPLSGFDDTLRKANPCMIELSGSGDLWLLFDYLESVSPSNEEQTNIYYVYSADKLSTVSAPIALTTYMGYSEKAEHPSIAQTSATELYTAFNKLCVSLHIDKDTTGWLGATSTIIDMHIDIPSQKLYVTSAYTGAGMKSLRCVAKIDLATWSIDKAWNTSTVPSFPSYFGATHIWSDSQHGESFYVPVVTNKAVGLLNTQTDTITTYGFYGIAAYGIPENVNWAPNATIGEMTISKAWVDSVNNKLYVALYSTYIWDVCIQIGWIDLTAPGPTYDFTTVVSDVKTIPDTQLTGFTTGAGFWEVLPLEDIIIVGMEGIASDWKGRIRIYTISSGGLWKDYIVDTSPSFPYRGLKHGIYNNGVIAGGFTYEPLYGQQEYRGLCLIDIATDIVTYNRPSWASVDNYELGGMTVTDDGNYLINAGSFGVTLFDKSIWTLYSNIATPGLTPNSENEFLSDIVYNPTTDMIITQSGSDYMSSSWSGFIMFSIAGYIKQTNHIIGAYAVEWTWGSINPLVSGFSDYDASISVDPSDGSLYAFWVNKAVDETSIKRDKVDPAFDLSPYIVKEQVVERSESIDPHSGNWDANLNFSVSHGHLFDVSNSASLLNQYLVKGRKIQQQFGEKVSGVEYWEPVRIFSVSDDGEVIYKRGEYPTMQVSTETSRKRWEQIHIIASEYYQTTPELMIASLLINYANILEENISLGTWENSTIIEYQFVDVTLSDAINQIAVHFGYCIKDGAAGVIESVKISDTKSVNRTYSDNSNIISVTPNNKYSDFTNNWTVQCEEKTFIELLMGEELCAEFATSHNWHTGKKKYRVEYSQGDKVYRNVRMEIVDSAVSFALSLASSFPLIDECSEEFLDESPYDADPNKRDTYCYLEVTTPDLTPGLNAVCSAIIGSYFVPDIVISYGAGYTIRLGTFISTFALFQLSQILSAVASASYRFYGQPISKVRRTVAISVDDLISQAKLGQVISGFPFNDPLCSSTSDCQIVANYLKMVGMGERARWSADMICDLHNEVGDTVSVIHPVSGDNVTVFLTDLTTTFLTSEINTDNGALQQTIEGWRK